MLRASLEVSTMRKALSFVAAAVVMLVSAKASASYHLMKVVEVFAGSAAQPNASYVQLQMYAAGQTFVNTRTLHVYGANGTELTSSSVTFTHDVTNGNDQATILVGTASVAAAFGVTPDFVLPANLDKAGGAVCWDVLDCFSWGNFTGTTVDTSVSPFAALTADKAARRIITTGTSATRLDAMDDGNNNAMDFAAVAPDPKNNSFGATPPPDAGPGVDASVPDSGSSGGKDSGIGTTPSPNNPTITPDSGTGAPSSSSSGDSGGCSVVSSPASGGWSTVLGLFTAASILVLSRRRRSRR
jgi:hypothetical protein